MLIIIGSNVHRCKSSNKSDDKKGNQSGESIIDLSKKSNILIELEKQKNASLRRETFCLLEDDLEDGEDRMRNELGEIVWGASYIKSGPGDLAYERGAAKNSNERFPNGFSEEEKEKPFRALRVEQKNNKRKFVSG